ncbi:ThiF family adenylyltransferase [Clostridium sp. ATCC 25772]|uniref:ThiF family adenylyltransferase n=1 Tax=Clostridium sp. ATCC 25772 TaxID=1676991 RepID=UPI0007837424|nr:ThiF family adenylyltransferase [Clostridium sp. ATCC 25772]
MKYKIRESVDVYIIGEDILYIYFMNTRQTIEFKVSKEVIDLVKCIDGDTFQEMQEKLKRNTNKNFSLESIKAAIEFLMKKNVVVEVIDLDKQIILSNVDVIRYDRQISYLSEFDTGELSGLIAQRNIKNTSICIFGCGAIGGNIALELVMTGIEKIILIDNGDIDESDSVRHLYFKNKYLGISKVEALKEELLLINKNINVECIKLKLTPETDIKDIILRSDFIVNTMDEPYIGYTSLKISRECVHLGKPHYIAGGFDIHLMSTGELIIPGITPCVECYTQYFKKKLSNWKPESKRHIDKVNEYGGLSSLSLFSSSYATMQIIKYIINPNSNDFKKMVRGEVNFNKYSIEYLDVSRNEFCVTCGGIVNEA